jgi:VCBS repeat protein
MRRVENYLWLAIVGAVGVVSGCQDATVIEPAPSAGSLRPLSSSSVSPLPTYRIKSFDAGTTPSAAKVADLDGDGLNDIVVVNLQGSLQVLYNDGAGSFTRVARDGLWPSTSSTLDVDVGDLNGDGRNDVAVAFTTQQGAVSALLNQGNRSFSAPVNYDACSASRGVAIGDLDRDGDKDLADIGGCSKAGILLNDGQGTFAFNGTYGTGSASRSIALADFNRDGANDIAYVNQMAGGTVTVLLNNGNGTFGAAHPLYAGDLPDDITVGDYDGDGNVDLAIANSYFSQVIVLFGSSDGSFSTGYSELSGGDTPPASRRRISTAMADSISPSRARTTTSSRSSPISAIMTFPLRRHTTSGKHRSTSLRGVWTAINCPTRSRSIGGAGRSRYCSASLERLSRRPRRRKSTSASRPERRRPHDSSTWRGPARRARASTSTATGRA